MILFLLLLRFKCFLGPVAKCLDDISTYVFPVWQGHVNQYMILDTKGKGVRNFNEKLFLTLNVL